MTKSTSVKVINIQDKLALFNEYWSPKIVGELNNHKVQVVKLKGEFVIIPHLIEHKPEAPEEIHIILIEPKSTVNTGNVVSKHTVQTAQEF
ncbi:hypothetical protein HY008_02805 [Candidatus Woesebacteria bacterium]|nr:hypothetical protein [Candidatus Woesebacteria bacterium]